MTPPTLAADAALQRAPYAYSAEPATSQSAVTWGAVLAGAAAAAALSMVLLILGVGLGLSSVSPWTMEGVSATTFGVSTVIWLTFTQLAASGMGGYLAGRLRTKWSGVHTDEAYFRDTAHGFLAWAVASLVTAAMLSSAAGAIVGAGAQAGATVAAGAGTAVAGTAAAAAKSAGMSGGMNGGMGASDGSSQIWGYSVDSLLRRDTTAAASSGSTGTATAGSPMTSTGDADNIRNFAGNNAANTAATSAEVGRIFANAVAAGSLPASDTTYLGQIVARRTGLSQADAEKRVNDTFAAAQAKVRAAQDAAKDAADKARKASAYAALWLFVSLLAGAFVGSLAATYGGRRRDLGIAVVA